VLLGRGEGRSQLGETHRRRRQLMTPFEPQVPDPLADHLPTFLPAGGMRTPAIRVLCLVFIGKGLFKRPTMQLQRHHISSGERLLRQGGQEQLVDAAVPFDANSALCRPGGMGRSHHPTARARRCKGHLGAVVERAAEVTFRATELLIWGEVQAGLHLRLLKHLLLFAAHHIGEAGEIGKHGSGALLPIQTEEGSLCWELMSLQVGLDCSHRAPQCYPGLAEARVARSEPSH
jgi:hypothetical protein